MNTIDNYNKPIKTLLFTLEYPPFKGGIANMYGNLVKYWSGDISVLHDNDHDLLSVWGIPKWLPAIFQLKKRIKKDKIDHIIVGHILPLGTVTYYVTKFTKTPYSVMLHGMDFALALKHPRKKKLAKKILDKAEQIICTNSYTANMVKQFLETGQDKVHTVNPGIEKDLPPVEDRVKEIKQKYTLERNITLFSVGRLVKRKGFDKVIEAMAEVNKTNKAVHYYLAGDGPDKKYIYDKAEGVANINFLGKISDEDKWAWLKACDIFIMPSRENDGDFEGFGIVYLEAALAGKPVIAGDSGGVRDAVKGAITGVLVDPEKIDRIAGSIILLAQDRALRVKLGEQARERAISEFNWEGQARKIYHIIGQNRN
jgi:phosphatidylinositol alpha-1,6-mannosyltransferase